MEAGAAAQSALYAAALIIKTYARSYGHDPVPALKKTSQRTNAIDKLMTEFVTDQAQAQQVFQPT